MSERVLITGASGFLGYHIIDAALAMGLKIDAAVRKSSAVNHLKQLQVELVYPDFDNVDSLKGLIEERQYQYIIHAAGVTKAISEDEYNRINAGYAINLGKAAALANQPIKKMVFVSSLAAIGPLAELSGVITEETQPRPVTSYGRSKLLAEVELSKLNLPLTIIRPTAIYGPREKDIFILFKTILKGWEPYIGRLPQQLTFVYAKDAAEVIINALFSQYGHTAYNISDGGFYDRYALADFTKLMLHRKANRIHLPTKLVKLLAFTLEKTYGAFNKAPVISREKLYELTASNWNCSIEKAKLELGFKPAYNLEYGLTETFDWYKNNKWI